MKAIKELKLRLPSERKAKGHSSTLNALKYALQCVKQVRGEGSFLRHVPDLPAVSLCPYLNLNVCLASQQGVLPPVERGGVSWLQSGLVSVHHRGA